MTDKRVRFCQHRLLLAVLTTLLSAGPAFAQTHLGDFNIGVGWATFGLAIPQGMAREGISVGNLPTQTDVKTRWSDGSIRFAVVTTRTNQAGDYPLSANALAAATSTVTARPPNVAVRFTTAGRTYVASAPLESSDTWLKGPLVVERRMVVAPRSGAETHPVLQVIFDIRTYADSTHRVDITVQNTKDVVEGDAVTYDVSVAVDNDVVFSKAGNTHKYLTRWRRTFGVRLAEAPVTPDFEPFFSAGALPRYLDSVANPSFPDLRASKYDILQFGDLLEYMPGSGWRPEISYYPDWVAQYIIHKQTQARAYLLKHADLSGSWSGHITEPDGTSLVSLDRYPNYWLDGRAGPHPDGPRANKQGVIPGLAQVPENAHLPNLASAAYLITGDRYYLDQQKLWANFTMLWTWPGDPIGPRTEMGLLWQNQVRGIGRALTVLVDTVAYLPDTDPERLYLNSRLDYNLKWLDQFAMRVGSGGPLGLTFHWKFSNPAGPYFSYSPWLDSYVAFALQRAADHGFEAGTTMRMRLINHFVRLMNATPALPREYGAPYAFWVGHQTPGAAPWEDPKVQQFFSVPEIMAINQRGAPGAWPQPLVGQYAPEHRAMLLLAMSYNIEGAAAALAWLESFPGVREDVERRSGYALAPRTSAPSTNARPSGPAPPPNVRRVR